MDNIKFGGFDLKIFLDQVNKDFICPICSFFVRNPKECMICGSLFCDNCLKQWGEKNPKNINSCPMRCKKENGWETVMRPCGKIIKNIMNSLKVKCPNLDCRKIMTLEEYEIHETKCNLPKCMNEKCNKEQEKLINYKDPNGNEFKFCSEFCKYSFIFQQICIVKDIRQRTNFPLAKEKSDDEKSMANESNASVNSKKMLSQDDKLESSKDLFANNQLELNIQNNSNDSNYNNNNNSSGSDSNGKINNKINNKLSLKYKAMLEENNPYINQNIDLTDWFHNFLYTTLAGNLHNECEKRITNLKNMIKAITGNNNLKINDNYYEQGITSFKWDKDKKGQGIQVYNNGESIFLNEKCYAFRTIVSTEGFMGGVHYFEIIPDKRTESELKVGITKNPYFNYDTSFSDYTFGWAFYGIGQLRHSNNANGETYGKKFKKTGILGVFLDMNKGVLSFSLDNEYLGIAFKSEELKHGPIYPAISLLHLGGCTLKTGICAQPYFFTDL